MKRNTLKTLALVVMLLVSAGAMAENTATYVYKLNGGDPGNTTVGTVEYTGTSTTGTIKVTPAAGYYLIVENLKVTKTIDGSNAQTRMDFDAPITVTPTDANADPSGETTYTFDISDTKYDYVITADFGARTSIVDATVELADGQTLKYTGEAIKPNLVVTLKGGTLTAGTDYNAYYQDSINAGTGKIMLVGIRKYTGTCGSWDNPAKTYTINPKSITGATITLSSESFTYNGQNQKPTTVSVKDGDTGLVLDTDYTLTNDGGTNVGEFSITITGKGNYTGEANKKYNINPKSIADATITISPENFTYNGESQQPTTVSVKDGNTDLVLDTDYTLTNDGGTNVGEYSITITGKGNYTGEANKKYNINPKSIADATITISPESFIYNGESQKPTTVSVKDGDTDLVLDTDYTLTNEGGTNVGEYNVTVAGKGNYDAQTTVTKKFTITKATPTLTYSSDKADARVGEAFTAPTLDNPSKVAVTYSSSKTDVATISEEGVITLVGAGETTITASFAGDGNYEAASASYVLTVEKKQNSGLSWTDEGMEYYLGDWWYGPRLNNPNNLKVKYKSSDEEVATIDEKGVVTALAVGDTWIMAIFEGNEMYDPQTVRYGLFVRERYDLLVNDTRVTSDNNRNVLGDGHFFYDENTKQLVVTSNDSPVTIESRMKNLTIFLNGSSKLDRIFFNNEGNEQNTGSLTITTYENIPGSVVLETSHADGVISGFSSLTIDDKSYTYLLDPAEGKYEGGKLVTSLGAVATTATIGQYLKPLVDGQTVTFPPGKFAIDDFTNMVIDDILYTMVLRADGSDEDDDFYDPVESAIVLNNLNSTSGVTMLIDNVEKSMLIPGSAEYALQFKGGITFMVPNGEGTITLNVKTEPGYKLMLMIGKSEPKEISQNERGDVQFTYNVEKATYVCVYLVQSAGTRGTRIGKRDKHHGSLYSIKVEPTKVVAMNPLGQVEGYPGYQKPEVVVHHSTGIKEIKIEPANETNGDDSWYDMQGRKIDKPTKAGIYIQNRKKIVIK